MYIPRQAYVATTKSDYVSETWVPYIKLFSSWGNIPEICWVIHDPLNPWANGSEIHAINHRNFLMGKLDMDYYISLHVRVVRMTKSDFFFPLSTFCFTIIDKIYAANYFRRKSHLWNSSCKERRNKNLTVWNVAQNMLW